VIGLVSGSVSAASRSLGHLISFFVTLVLMLVVNGFMVYTLKNRDKSQGCCKYYGPLILTIFATFFIMADLVRHLLQDHGVWPECDRSTVTDEIWPSKCNWSSSQYKCSEKPSTGHCVPNSHENISHLSVMGVVFTIIFTYTGFLLLMIGSFWNANICQKLRDIRQVWRESRREKRQRGNRRRNHSAQASAPTEHLLNSEEAK